MHCAVDCDVITRTETERVRHSVKNVFLIAIYIVGTIIVALCQGPGSGSTLLMGLVTFRP